MFEKKFSSEESQYEIFHDLHLRVNDLMERASIEYTKKLKGAMIATIEERCSAVSELGVYWIFTYKKSGTITHVKFKIGATKGNVVCRVFYTNAKGKEASILLYDPFINPADNLSDVVENYNTDGVYCWENCIISKDEKALEAEIAEYNAKMKNDPHRRPNGIPISGGRLC